MRKITTIFRLSIIVISCLYSAYANGQSQILAFKFISTDNGKQATNTSTSTNANLETSVLSRGAGAAATSSSARSTVANFPASANRVAALTSGSYFEFFVQAKSGYHVSLTELNVTLRRQSESAYIYRWGYSIDGGSTFKEVGNADVAITDLNNEGVAQPVIDLSAFSDLQNVPSSTTILFRIYAWGGVPGAPITTSAFGIGKSSSAGSNAISVKGYLSNIPVPGVVLGHRTGSTNIYLGSPAICVLPDSSYVAAGDFFGPNPAARVDGKSVTRIYKSLNQGQSWFVVTDLVGQFMSNLFVHQNNLYILGLSGNEGDVVIRKSTDGGYSWTTPTDSTNGVIRTGNYHTAPTPVVKHNGKLWRAMENTDGAIQTWPKKFQALMLSVPENADLLQGANWTSSNALPYDASYLFGYFYGWLEGNAVIDPNGNMLNVIRVHTFDKLRERVALIKVDTSGTTASFNSSTGFKDFPGGGKKFTIRYDSASSKYWTLSNYVPAAYKGGIPLDGVRNTLALCSSGDLLTWTIDTLVLQHPDTLYHAFQYVDWQFDGNDIVAVSRTAYDDGLGGANSFHNNNYLTFHRIPGFRSITPTSDQVTQPTSSGKAKTQATSSRMETEPAAGQSYLKVANPVREGALTLLVSAKSGGKGTLRVIDLQGKVLLNKAVQLEKGRSTINVAFANTPGIYVADILVKPEENLQCKFVVP